MQNVTFRRKKSYSHIWLIPKFTVGRLDSACSGAPLAVDLCDLSDGICLSKGLVVPSTRGDSDSVTSSYRFEQDVAKRSRSRFLLLSLGMALFAAGFLVTLSSLPGPDSPSVYGSSGSSSSSADGSALSQTMVVVGLVMSLVGVVMSTVGASLNFLRTNR